VVYAYVESEEANTTPETNTAMHDKYRTW
jgi:hypothetical protein